MYSQDKELDLFAGTTFGRQERVRECAAEVAKTTAYPANSSQALFLAHLVVVHGHPLVQVTTQNMGLLLATHAIRHKKFPDSVDHTH